MKLQFPLSASVIFLSFGAVSCQISDAEISTRGWTDPPLDTTQAGTGEYASAGTSGQDAPDNTEGSAGAGGSDAPNVYDGTAGTSETAGGAGGSTSGSDAGSGGSDAAGGTGGTTAAGSGGADAAGGSGGSASAGTGGGSSEPTCPTDYMLATHIVINVSWKETYALTAGSGQVHVWTKSHFVEDGSTASVESQTCGSTLPPIQTTQLAGDEKILPEIPNATWDAPNMPHFMGSATRDGDMVTVDPGVALVGLSMSNPKGVWPDAPDSIISVDHDGDGNAGVTAIPKQDGGFSAPPVNISLVNKTRADKLYLATRNIMTLSANVPGCPETYTGTANVTNFENHIIGCHVKGGDECSSGQTGFVDDNRTVYIVGSASFTSVRVSADATCADVRAAVPD